MAMLRRSTNTVQNMFTCLTKSVVTNLWCVGMHPPSGAKARYIFMRSANFIDVMYNFVAPVNVEHTDDLVQGVGRHKIVDVKDNGKGYVQFSWLGVNKFVTHTVVGALHNAIQREEYYGLTEQQLLNWEGSHRCKNVKCMRHICWESHETNNDRKTCQGSVLIDGKLHNMCPHHPKCVFVTLPPVDQTLPSQHSTSIASTL